MKPNPNAETLAEMLRVDHAGEYGANRIYEGQLMVLGKTAVAPTIKHMLEQEQDHLKKFDELLNDNKVRPSALMPIWHIAGLALGIGSALLGKKAAMACTVAVEEVIEQHYNQQLEQITDENLRKTITKFRDEEVEHRNTGIEHEAKQMAGYDMFTKMIKLGAKVSIFLAKKISYIIIPLAICATSAQADMLQEGTEALKNGNYVAATNIIQPLAVQGNPDAQFALCGMYYQAQGVPKNDIEAARWCHASAQNGHIEAMFNLALLYQNGEGVGQNFNEAKKWYNEAAMRGNQNAQTNLAMLNGTLARTAKQMPAPMQAAPAPAMQVANTAPQITKQATAPAQVASLAPVRIAAPAQIQTPAQNIEPASGNTKSGGLKFVKDEEPPILLVETPTDGDPYTACKIAEDRGQHYDICQNNKGKKPQNPEVVTTDLMKPHSFAYDTGANFSTALELAKKGNAEAQNNLGAMYLTGNGVAKNYSEALKWLEKSASNGNPQAMMNLATMYRDGNGTTANKQLAYSWFNLAADRSKDPADKQFASENVRVLSRTLNNEQIGNALQFVSKLDEKIPQI